MLARIADVDTYHRMTHDVTNAPAIVPIANARGVSAEALTALIAGQGSPLSGDALLVATEFGRCDAPIGDDVSAVLPSYCELAVELLHRVFLGGRRRRTPC